MSPVSSMRSPTGVPRPDRRSEVQELVVPVGRGLDHATSLEHLLLATDFADPMDKAFLRALELTRSRNAQLNVLHVVESGLPKRIAARRKREARALIQEQIGSLDQEKTCDITVTVREGEPFIEIVREAIELDSEAIVLGGEGRQAPNTESMAACLLRYCERPILVVRKSPDGAYSRVVMDVELSAAGARVISSVKRIAPEAEVHVLHTIEPWSGPALVTAVGSETRVERLNRLRAFIGANEHGANGHLHVVCHGSIAIVGRTIIDDLPPAAKRHDADLIATGTAGLLAAGNAALAETIRRLISISPCDVLIAPLWSPISRWQ